MADARYPTLEEFWRRLDRRDVEPDLREALRKRVERDQWVIHRLAPVRTVLAVAARILPSRSVPAQALAAFLDERFDQRLGRGDEKENTMPREELIPMGFRVLDDAAEAVSGTGFASLHAAQQDELLARAEAGSLEGPERFDSAVWFKRVRSLLLLAYGSDPRGMVEMGFPGPSFKPGHVWLDEREVAARAKRRPGYLDL